MVHGFVGGGGTAMAATAQPRGVPGMNTGLGATSLDGSSAPGLSNLETIIAATVRAVTGQLGGLDSSVNGTLMHRNVNPSVLPAIDMTAAGSGAFGMNRWSGTNMVGADGVSGLWGGEMPRRSGSTGMPSADAVRSGLLASDSDPNTLYVGNVSCDQ